MVPTVGKEGISYIDKIAPFCIKLYLCVIDQMFFVPVSWSLEAFRALGRVGKWGFRNAGNNT